jgi:hypothetical protein
MCHSEREPQRCLVERLFIVIAYFMRYAKSRERSFSFIFCAFGAGAYQWYAKHLNVFQGIGVVAAYMAMFALMDLVVGRKITAGVRTVTRFMTKAQMNERGSSVPEPD